MTICTNFRIHIINNIVLLAQVQQIIDLRYGYNSLNNHADCHCAFRHLMIIRSSSSFFEGVVDIIASHMLIILKIYMISIYHDHYTVRNTSETTIIARSLQYTILYECNFSHTLLKVVLYCLLRWQQIQYSILKKLILYSLAESLQIRRTFNVCDDISEKKSVFICWNFTSIRLRPSIELRPSDIILRVLVDLCIACLRPIFLLIIIQKIYDDLVSRTIPAAVFPCMYSASKQKQSKNKSTRHLHSSHHVT